MAASCACTTRQTGWLGQAACVCFQSTLLWHRPQSRVTCCQKERRRQREDVRKKLEKKRGPGQETACSIEQQEEAEHRSATFQSTAPSAVSRLIESIVTMKVWLCIISISFSIMAGSCLQCKTCKSTDKADCKGPSVTCPASANSCLSSLIQVTRPDDDGDNDDDTDIFFAKSCAEKKFCGERASATIDKTHVNVLTACCSTDNCANTIPKIPQRNLTENGVQCPWCFSYELNGCTPGGKKMKCTGLKTKCITYSGPLYVEDDHPNGSYQGCGTPSFCQMALDPKSNIKITCSDPTKR